MTVTVQSALDAVQAAAERLSEAVHELVLIAVEDQPRDTEVHLVTVINDAVLDLAAEAEQAGTLLRADGQLAAVSRAGASRAVAGCQAHVNATGALLVRELATPRRLNDLAALGRQHGREAGAWAKEIVRCIESCQQLIWTDMQPALLGFWLELADATARSCAPGDGD
jgi:hypothetical protein